MKKILILAISVLLVCTVAVTPVFATMSTPNVDFYPETLKLEVSGTVSDSNKDTVTLMITQLAENEITTSQINSGKVFFVTTKTNKLGEYNISYKLATSTPGGQYNVYVSCNGESTKNNFLFFNQFLANQALLLINGASETAIGGVIGANLEAFGLEEAEFLAYSEYIAPVVYNCKPQGGYDIDGFVSMYKTAVAVGSIKKGDNTLAEAIINNASYVGVAIDEYEALEEEIKTETEYLFKTLPYDSLSFKAAFDEYVLLSKVRTAKDAENLGNIVITEHESLGIDLTKYNKINNDYYQANVFVNIYNASKTVTDFEGLKILFDNEVTVQAVEAKGNKDKAPSSAGGGGGGGGGASIPKDSVNVFVPQVEEVVTVPEEETAIFSDIENHWAKDVIEKFVKTEIITGYPDGTFKPNNTVTRAEFSVLIYKMLSLSPVFEKQFADVNEEDWFYKYINAVGSKGIVTGYDGIFNPDAPVSRQDMAVMVYRMLEIGNDTEYSYNFKDHNDISGYAVDAVYALESMGVINGSDGRFSPKNNATRAEAVKILSNALEFINE